MGRIREGMPVKLTIGALEISWMRRSNTSRRKAPGRTGHHVRDQGGGEIPEDVFIRAGYSANADILVDRREGVISIPESSIEFEGTKTFVNLPGRGFPATDQTFRRKEIQIGLSNGVNVEVTEGLTGNEQIRRTKTTPTK